MWSTSAWRSSCKSHTPLRDRLWPPVCPNHGRGRVSAPPSGSEPDLGQFHGPYRGRKEKQDKGQASRPPLCPSTSARSAGSSGRFPDGRKWGQFQNKKLVLRSYSPNAYSHKKKIGVIPRKGAYFEPKREVCLLHDAGEESTSGTTVCWASCT